ncbi:MAG: GNAT family N-acetyltransferase [Chthoniobacteraceae bacterium]
MSPTFRTATSTDIPVLRDLADCIWRISYPGMISIEQIEYMLGWMYSAEKIAAELSSGVNWEIALLDERPIGFTSLTLHSRTLAELNKLYLLPELHGRGLGQAMLAHATESAAPRGCTELRLRVNKRNARALRCYDRAGFRVIDSLTADIGGGFVMDDYVLSRSLAPHMGRGA